MTGFRLAARLDASVPSGLQVASEAEVLLSTSPLTVRIPDVLVVSRAAYETSAPRFRAADVRVLVEIVSSGSGRIDRVTKASEYAEAAVPEYWIVDLEPSVTLTRLVLEGDSYVEVEVCRGHTSVTIGDVAIALDLDALPR